MSGPNDHDEQWAGPRDRPAADDATRAFDGPAQQQPEQPQAPYQQWQPHPQQQYQGQPYPQQQPYPEQQYPQQPYGQYPPQQQPWGQGYPQQQPYQGQPQPGQQYPQQPYGQQAYPTSTATGTRKSNLPLILGLVGGLVAIAAVAIVLFFVLTAKDTLDQNAAQQGVARVLTESYGAQDVSDVSCPSGQKVEKDATFQCTATISGESKNVTVRFTDDKGTYEVGRPD